MFLGLECLGVQLDGLGWLAFADQFIDDGLAIWQREEHTREVGFFFDRRNQRVAGHRLGSVNDFVVSLAVRGHLY